MFIAVPATRHGFYTNPVHTSESSTRYNEEFNLILQPNRINPDTCTFLMDEA